MVPTPLSAVPKLAGARILVTGGTGFIGGRLVERLLLQHAVQVRVLVRNLAHAPRIACFPVELVQGDVTEPSDVRRAAEGCDLLYHCAYGNSGSPQARRMVNIGGTVNVLDAALHTDVKRVVYLSTRRVYGNPEDGILDESAPRLRSGNPYSDTKLEAEEIVLKYARTEGLPVTILQPTTVYGPYAPVWTLDVIERLKTEKVILVDGGGGLCNAVYIDDVVSAMLLAAVEEAAVGEAMLISGEHPVSWCDFYSRFSEMVDGAELVSLSAEELRARYQAHKPKRKRGLLGEGLSILREDREIRMRLMRTQPVTAMARAGRAILPKPVRETLKKRAGLSVSTPARARRPSPDKPPVEKPLPLMSPVYVDFYTPRVSVCIDKARRLLGYEPAFDLDAGLELTERWARWANLL
jgi:nucleoside-diphosphate-sugar epimerase